MRFACFVFSAFLLTASLNSIAQAAEQADLATQAITLLHPHYVSAAQSKNSVATVESGIILLANPSFKMWAPAVGPLPANAGNYYLLALAERNDRPNEGGNNIELGLFVEKDGKLSVVAHGVIDQPDLVVEQGVLAGAELDLTPYKINERETAFGVRVASFYTSTSTHIEGENLYLIRAPSEWPPTDELYPIFNAPISEEESGSPAKKSTALFLPHKTEGFYDLQVKDGKKTTSFFWSEASRYYENPDADQNY